MNFDPQMLGGASIVFAVGFGIVFLVLILVILILTIEGKIFAALSGKGKKAPAKKAAPAPAPAPALVAAPAPAAAAADEDEEIAAVIAAVIAMYAAEGGNGLVVRSVRRVGMNTPAWSASGRQEYMGTRY